MKQTKYIFSHNKTFTVINIHASVPGFKFNDREFFLKCLMFPKKRVSMTSAF